jgi:hypothetical protein
MIPFVAESVLDDDSEQSERERAAHILVNTLVSIVNRMILVNALSLNGATSAFRRLVSCKSQKSKVK